MKRVFVLRKYIFFRWGKKTLNKVFGRNLPFCRTYCWERCRRFFFFAVGLEDECFETGFHFRFMVLWVFSRQFRVGNFGEIHVGLAVGFVSFSYFCCCYSLLYSVVF